MSVPSCHSLSLLHLQQPLCFVTSLLPASLYRFVCAMTYVGYSLLYHILALPLQALPWDTLENLSNTNQTRNIYLIKKNIYIFFISLVARTMTGKKGRFCLRLLTYFFFFFFKLSVLINNGVTFFLVS